jgi:NADPH2:quinone reductase
MSEVRNRRLVVFERGGPQAMQVVEEDLPEPEVGEVRVRTEVAGVSAFDLMLRSKRFPGFPRLPYTPGVDVVGVVDAVGEDVPSLETGQRIAALLRGSGGGYSEYVCLPAADAVPVPAGLDVAEAVCVVANYITAYSMMHRVAEVREGERILVHGAAGGVGTALLELGRLAGLEMYGTASDYNHGLVSSMGATPIDYRKEDFVVRIRELTGDGVDVVFDPIGGARQVRRSYRALRKRGRLVWFGVAAVEQSGVRVILGSLFMNALLTLLPDGKKAPLAPDIAKDDAVYRETLTTLLDWLAAGRLEPLIAARIPLMEAVRAHELLEGGGYAGKVVLVAGGAA